MRRTILAALAILIAGTSVSLAQQKLKVAIPQKGFWDSSWVEFGEAAGFFKEAGLEVSDRISLHLVVPADRVAAVEAHRDLIAAETLAVDLTVVAGDTTEPVVTTRRVER